jgi:hypothetical protein
MLLAPAAATPAAPPVVNFGADAAPGADLRREMAAACDRARATGAVLRLPPIRFVMGETCSAARVHGTAGRTVVVLAPDFRARGHGVGDGQFAFENPSFATRYVADPAAPRAADAVDYRDFAVEVRVDGAISVLGLANVRSGSIARVDIRAPRVLAHATGLPWPRDALIDLYAAVRKVRIVDNVLENVTGARIDPARPDHRFRPGGGSCIWVRNVSADGSVPDNVTQDITISGNICRHYTTDEMLSVFGVRGVTRRVAIRGNCFLGLPNVQGNPAAPPGGIFHNSGISVFALNDGSGARLGAAAAVHDVDFTGNYVEDHAFLFSVVRFGNSADAHNRSDAIRSSRNVIVGFRSDDAARGPDAAWRRAGSPGGAGVDPMRASVLLRNIAAPGTPPDRVNTTTGDTVTTIGVGGKPVAIGIAGFTMVVAPIVRGRMLSGTGYVSAVRGGLIAIDRTPPRAVVGADRSAVRAATSSARTPAELRANCRRLLPKP